MMYLTARSTRAMHDARRQSAAIRTAVGGVGAYRTAFIVLIVWRAGGGVGRPAVVHGRRIKNGRTVTRSTVYTQFQSIQRV